MGDAVAANETARPDAPTRRSIATYADVLAAPKHLVAEILDGELVTHPRPAPKHAVAASNLGMLIGGPFDRGRGGPGGWVVLDEPELHFGSDVIVPDLAAWRREHFAGLPKTPYFTQAPDWVCEVLSPSTERHDRRVKRAIYARAAVAYYWMLDPRQEILETFELQNASWKLTNVFEKSEQVAAPPFDAVPFDLPELWPFSRTEPAEDDVSAAEPNA